MFGWNDSDICPIGMDVGTHSIRLVQFRQQKAQLTLLAARRVEIDSVPLADSPEKHLTELLRNALETGDFRGRHCVISLPPADIHAKSVRLPQMPENDLAHAIQWEAKDRFGLELADGRLVYFRAGEVRRGTEIKEELLLFAATGDTLRKYMGALAPLRFTIDAIDLAPCAMIRAVHRATPSKQNATTAILDVGHTGAQFLLCVNDQIVFYKHIDIGGKTLNEAVAAKLGISLTEATQIRSRLLLPATADEDGSAVPLQQAVYEAMRPKLEELTRELDMCLRYYVVTFRGARPEQVSVVGRQADCSQLLEIIANGLGIRVEAAPVLRGVSELDDKARPDRSSEWAVAAGLSLYPVSRAKAPVAA